jgi:aminopeptidase N
VRDYLNSRLYGNARTEDLWTAAQAASGVPVLEIARNFTSQPGYPVLAASGANCRRERNNGTVNLTQRRFALDDASRTDELWSIPVVARRVGGEDVRSVLPRQANSSVDVGSCGAYLVNAGQSGFFRVHYDGANFARLVSGFATLDSADQLGLLSDYWAFGRSGDAPFTSYLELAQAAPASADPYVLGDVAASLSVLAGYASDRPSEDAVKAYARNRISPMLARLGWDTRPNDTSNVIQLRAAVIGALGGLGDDAVIAEARRRVAAAESDPTALPAGIRDAALNVYASSATEAEYDELLARARSATDFVEQRRAWRRVAAARDEALAQRSLQLILGEDIPRQLRPSMLTWVSIAHPQMGWDFLVANRATMEGLLDPLSRLEYPLGIAGQSSDPAMADALVEYASNFPAGAQPSVASTAANIRLRARTIEQGMPAAEAWIARHRAAPRGR